MPLRSPFDLVTLASLVEKETGKADERPHVAGVFLNRLRKHMRLQSDPTIVYGLVGGQGTLGHSITRAELDKKTPYNTYQIDGLPPGPITNPGRAALEAVANPSRTSDLYFVADGTGGHAFSDTVEDHNKNVQRWRQIERDAKDKVDVDKLSPNAVSPTSAKGGNQRSDAGTSVFGSLPTNVASVSFGRVSSFQDPTLNHDIDKIFAADERGPEQPLSHDGSSGVSASMPNPATFAASIDGMALALDGNPAAAAPKAADILDGPITPAADAPTPNAAADTASAHPVASRSGTRTAALDATAPNHPDLFSDADTGGPAPVPMKIPPEHPKIYDASENTPFDPLRNKSYDLNTAKAIPADLVR